MTRFEGSAGSGKTTASKLISALLYGEPQHKKATDAANYTDGSQNPLIVLDNIEVKQMTEDLTTFMLTSITGIAKEKRKSGTDSETVTERTKCLLNTTGIEPLCGELSEIQSRSFVINFDIGNQGNDCFIESDVIAALQRNRDLIISALMKRTSEVLAMMKDGMRTQAMKLLHEALGNHDKRRCNEYLSLMYLMLLAGSSQDQIEQGMSTLAPAFKQQIQTINQTSRETARDSNHTATALSTLFKAWRTAVEADRKDMYNDRRVDHIQEFVARYQVQLEEDGCLKEVLSRELFVALKRVARDFGLRFEMDSSRQFAQRFANDLETIREAGFEVVISQKRYGTKLYTIQSVEP
jgi:DNA primase